MKRIFRLRTLLFIVFFVMLLIQLFRIDKTNQSINPGVDFISIENPPAEVASLIKSACYDCHSNETIYPWYTEIAPFSWIIKSHISEGREKLNFSEWGNYQPGRRGHKRDECREMVEKDEMPLSSYKFLHSNARFTKTQKDSLISWLTVE